MSLEQETSPPQNSESQHEEIKIENPIEHIEEEKEEVKKLSKIKKISEFDEEKYKIRKYNNNNLKEGKEFFRLRFLKNKIKEIHLKIKANQPNPLLSSVFVKSDKNNMLKYQTKYLNKREFNQKFIEKYTCLFLRLLEKSIMLFNANNFEASYSILKSYDIIKNPTEFGEILLVIQGYEKEIIQPVLTNKVGINENYELLKGFFQAFDMKCEDLFECYKFIISKITISDKDPEGNLIIFNEISKKIFEDNKSNEKFVKIYKDENKIHAFLNTIHNTLISFNKEEEFQTGKEEFEDLTNYLEIENIGTIYDEMKKMKNNNDKDNFIKYFYERLTILAKNIPDNTEEFEDKELIEEQTCQPKIKITKYSVIPNDFSEKDKNILEEVPTEFTRIIGDKTTINYYLLVDNFKRLYFDKSMNTTKEELDKIFKAKKPKLKHGNYINMTEVTDIYLGIEHSDNLKKYIKSLPNEHFNPNHFLTINCAKEKIDLKAENSTVALQWYYAFKSLMIKNKNYVGVTEKKEKKEKDNKKEIDNIWKSYIVPKWNTYGNYFLFMSLDRQNVLEPYFDSKNPTTVKSEYLEDKKNTINKAINIFLKELQDKYKKKEIEFLDFLSLCKLGIPEFIRPNLWPILIGNNSNLMPSLYDSLKEQIIPLDNIMDLEAQYQKDININFFDSCMTNTMIKDIIKIKKNFINEMTEKKMNPNKIMSHVYMICQCFYLYRFDIPYNRNIIYIIYKFLLLENNEKKIQEKKIFTSLYNLICSNTCLTKFYFNKEKHISLFQDYFENQLNSLLPKVSELFIDLGITPNLYLYDWIEGFFIQVLDEKLSSYIFDLYLIFGENVIVQTALTILKIFEEQFENLSLNEIFDVLKKSVIKKELEEFLLIYKNFNIYDSFSKIKIEIENANQRNRIFKVIYDGK